MRRGGAYRQRRDLGAAPRGRGSWREGAGLRLAHLCPAQVPHRLLTLTLLPGLELCLLCGPRPPLSQLDAQVNPGHVPLFPYFTLCRRAPAGLGTLAGRARS